MEAQAISALVVAFLQRGLSDLNNTVWALTLISDQAAEILDDDHSLYARCVRRTLHDVGTIWVEGGVGSRREKCVRVAAGRAFIGSKALFCGGNGMADGPAP